MLYSVVHERINVDERDSLLILDIFFACLIPSTRVGPDLVFLPDAGYLAGLSGIPFRICRIIRLFLAGYGISGSTLRSAHNALFKSM